MEENTQKESNNQPADTEPQNEIAQPELEDNKETKELVFEIVDEKDTIEEDIDNYINVQDIMKYAEDYIPEEKKIPAFNINLLSKKDIVFIYLI